jgi:hypothetical protein
VYTTQEFERECGCYRTKEWTSTRTYTTVTVSPTETGYFEGVSRTKDSVVFPAATVTSLVPRGGMGVEVLRDRADTRTKRRKGVRIVRLF